MIEAMEGEGGGGGRGGGISVVIVNYNTREMTLACLTRLYESLGRMAAEIFVVDNGSVDGSVEAIQSAFPAVHVIANGKNMGFGSANNQAMRLATGDYFLLLNSDAFPKPGAIAALLEYMQGHPKTGIVGPRLLNADGSLQRSCYRSLSPWRAMCDQLLLSAAMPSSRLFGDYRKWAHDHDRQVEMVIGACMLVRREAIKQVGMFDEDFFLYSEEADWCKRFRRHGWAIDFTPSAQVIHLNGASGGASEGGSGKEQSDRVFTEFHRGQERLQRKYYGGLGLAWYRTMVVCGAVIRMILFRSAGLISPGRRAKYFATAAKWARLLWWTIGQRGPGLSELQPSRLNSSEAACV